MSDIETLSATIETRFEGLIERMIVAHGEITLEIPAQHLQHVALALRDEPAFHFDALIDICGVDYLHYGVSDWQTETATGTGFSRGVMKDPSEIANDNLPYLVASPPPPNRRFASVYHLLSLKKNHRIRCRVFLDESSPVVPSVVAIWPAANWFEREAFDLFGIFYEGHPDLRRILTDYGFVGHPFRKDFPLIGHVEARYDAKERRVIYEPVSIEPRILEPKVIRTDPRYQAGES